MNVLRRLAAVAACIMLLGFVFSQPANAATDLQPWVANPDGWSNVGAFGNLLVEQGHMINVNFGTKGTALAPEATMSVPSYPGITLSPNTPGCANVGADVRCANTAYDGLMIGGASLFTSPNTPLGYVGMIVVTALGGARATIPLWVISSAKGADFEIRATDVSGKVGDTVRVTVSVINHGPSPQPGWEIEAGAPGTVVVGQHGCSPGAISGIGMPCAFESITPAGARFTITFDLKIVKIVDPMNPNVVGGINSNLAIGDPNSSNDKAWFFLNVSGGSGSGGGGSGPVPGAPPPGRAAPAQAASSASSTPGAQPTTSSPVPSAPPPADDPAPPAAAQPASSDAGHSLSPTELVAAGTGIALAAVFVSLSTLRRRRRTVGRPAEVAAPAEPAEDLP